MSLHKTAHTTQHTSSGLSLLQGLFVLAVLGAIAAVVASHFA